MKNEIPRQFQSLIDETGMDDLGASGLTFKVTSLVKGKIYVESQKVTDKGKINLGHLVDDNGCCRTIGKFDFDKTFVEVNKNEPYIYSSSKVERNIQQINFVVVDNIFDKRTTFQRVVLFKEVHPHEVINVEWYDENGFAIDRGLKTKLENLYKSI